MVPRTGLLSLLAPCIYILGVTWICKAGGVGLARVPVRRFVPSFDVTRFDTELDNVYVNESVSLNSSQTALVLVDVWNDGYSPSLTENEHLRILPLLTLARREGWLIIHAPSENKEWAGISVLPGEILVTGEDGRPGSASLCAPRILDSSRDITHVLMAGFDTNFCMIDKPCGSVTMATSLWTDSRHIQLLLVRDATLPESRWYHTQYYSYLSSVNLIESAAFLPAPPEQQFVRSAVLVDVARAFQVPVSNPIMINATTPLKYPIPSADGVEPATATVPLQALRNGTAALVVVSCTNDWANDGFRARVSTNRYTYLEPLLTAVRVARLPVIHVPNGHSPDGVCEPQSSEYTVNSTEAFDAILKAAGIRTLLYVGYAANRDMLFGVAGMARYYSAHRYLFQAIPDYFWVGEATVGFETAMSLAGGEWAKRQALAYRQPLVTARGNVLPIADLLNALSSLDQSTTSSVDSSGGGLPPAELDALYDLYTQCGGQQWQYNHGTDVLGKGKPWSFDPVEVSGGNARVWYKDKRTRASQPNPCVDGWFGVGCDATEQHVTALFPNTRHSGNPLLSCQLPDSIANLTYLEHLYTSNDATPSSLVGGVPSALARLTRLKCIYFSHNKLSLPFPRELSRLTQLQVFLARCNDISGTLPDMSNMKGLRNIWVDHNQLTGTLAPLTNLQNLTFVRADHNNFDGQIPSNLCAVTCNADHNSLFGCPLPVPGCCNVTACGDAPHEPPDPVPVSMGDCFPQ